MLKACFSGPKAPAPAEQVTVSEEVASRVLQVLAENRERPARIEFVGYTKSAEHAARLEALPAHLRIPPSEWRAHPNYKGRFQMPNFHHDFRQELQAIIATLWEEVGNAGSIQNLAQDVSDHRGSNPEEAEPASDAASKVARAKTSAQRWRAALDVWAGFKQHLDKHVGIEERAIFPSLRAHYPDLNFEFLYEDHKELLASETDAISKLKLAASRSGDEGAISAALDAVVRFDENFMNHLGEEEEFVVPLCLSTRHCALHGPRP